MMRRPEPPAPASPGAPYFAGALLGLVAAFSITLLGHSIGASAGVAQIAGLFVRRVAPNAVYWSRVVPPGLGWSAWLLVGAMLGAFVSARVSRRFAVRRIPEAGWVEIFGPSVTRRWWIAFFGAALVQFGAGISGGCTSGLAISGGVVLAPAAFVFVAAMFAGGMPVSFAMKVLSRPIHRDPPRRDVAVGPIEEGAR